MKITTHRNTNIGFNMTPMIDVVFLLIIFFLVASHFTRQETSMEVDLPKINGGDPVRDDAQRRVILNVVEENQLFLGSMPVKLENLSDILKQHLLRHGRDFQVRIRANRRTEYRIIEPILSACARAGIRDVQFAVTQ